MAIQIRQRSDGEGLYLAIALTVADLSLPQRWALFGAFRDGRQFCDLPPDLRAAFETAAVRFSAWKR